ncbi:MAG: glycosyltransferase [Candidatus Latescibacteria bacterium]|nr:glycosyltransferase [Candidatus Latescibacterota bacterium]
MPERKLSVLMPAFNEGRHIYRNVAETRRTLQEIGISYEIIVIDDCSADDTAAEVARAAADFGDVRLKRNEENRGKGWALKSGFKAATGDRVAFVDSDLDIHPRQLGLYLRTMEEQGADVVIASKRHPGSHLDYPAHRKAISALYFWIVKTLFGLPIRDTQTGLKLFRHEVLDRVFHRMLVKRWAFDLELLVNAHHLGYRIVDAPVKIDFQRRLGRMKFRDLYHTGLDTLAVFYRLRVLRFYDRAFERTKARPKVSIVIAVKGPNPYLAECLDHCLRLDYPDYEVIVLPDAPFAPPDPRIRVIPTGVVGPSEKRDVGTRAAAGELVAFLDDDAYPISDWLTNATANFISPDIAAVGGPGVTPASDGYWAQVSGAVYASLLVSGPHVCRYTPRRHREVDDYPSCNLIVRKSAFEQVGGFGNRFWPGEDTVFCLRIVRDLKKKILYDPDVMVYHHRRPRISVHFRQVWNYAVHRGYFVKRFPETSRRIAYFLPSLFVAGVCLGWLPGLWSPALARVYAGALAAYLLTVLVGTPGKLNPKFYPATVLGVIATHFTYGIGFIRGLLARKLREEG